MSKNGTLCCVPATIDLNHVRVFVTVRATGSFAAAAEKLGVPRSTVSRAVASLETALGARLFHRTTRKVSMSTAGLAFYDSVGPSMGMLEASLAELPQQAEVPIGTLRVTTTADLGVAVLGEATARYLSRYPGTRVEAILSTGVVDLVEEGFDLALRVSSQQLQGDSLVAQRVGSYSLCLYASPIYLARRREPRTLGELSEHEFVGLSPARFGIKGVTSRVESNDFFYYRALLEAGAGIGLLPSFLASSAIASGALARVLPRWTAAPGSVHIVQPSRKHQPRKVTAFREVLLELLRQRSL